MDATTTAHRFARVRITSDNASLVSKGVYCGLDDGVPMDGFIYTEPTPSPPQNREASASSPSASLRFWQRGAEGRDSEVGDAESNRRGRGQEKGRRSFGRW